MTPTQHLLLDWLERHGPSSLPRIAEAHGMARKTAAGHLNKLCQEGRCYATGRGPQSRWKLGTKPEKPAAVARGTEWHPIWQCPSVWAYAQRLQAERRAA